MTSPDPSDAAEPCPDCERAADEMGCWRHRIDSAGYVPGPAVSEGSEPQKCSMYLPDDNTICDEWAGHDGGMHTPVGMEQLSLREAEERRFLARKHDGKNPYASKSDAKRAAAMTTTTFGGARKMAYRCPVCDSWHVGASR